MPAHDPAGAAAVPIAGFRPSGEPEREDSHALPDGRRQAWAEWGPPDGRPVLLMHGAPGSSHVCPDVIATHAAGVRLIAPDRPGYGGSSPMPGRRVADAAADARALLDHLGIGSVAIVGWSSGVAFALAIAHGLGSRVTGLALIAGDAPDDERAAGEIEPAAGERLDQIRRDPGGSRPGMLERGRWFAEDPGSILPESRSSGDGPGADVPDGPDAALRRAHPAVTEMLLAMFRHAARQGAAGWVDDSIAAQLPWGFVLADVHQAATVWFGELDPLASLRDSALLAERLSRGRLVLVPDEGHALPVRHWSTILEDVLAGEA